MRTKLTLALVLALAPLAARGGENLTPEVLLPGHGATDAYKPVAAFGKDVFLLVWRAGRNEDADLVGLRLSKSGKPLDAKPFVISDAEECQGRPRVAFGGGNFLVVWQDLRNGKDWDVYAARVTPEGKVLDPDGIAVAALKHNQAQPAVCFDGSAFQIVWRDMRDGGAYDLFAGRVGPDGRALDGTGVLALKRLLGYFGDTFMPTPGVGANGKGEVLAAVKATRGQAFAIQPMRGGKPAGGQVSLSLGRKSGGSDPLFASDGKKLLMIFTTFRPVSRGGSAPASGAVLLDASLGKDGLPKAPIALSDKKERASCLRNPSPAWDGKTYVVAWDMLIAPRKTVPYDTVSLRRVSAEGKPLGADVPVAGERGSPACHPAVVSDAKGTTLIAYERHPKTPDVPIKIGFRMLRAK